MVTYNSAKHIGEAIASVLSQTYLDFELVICDDHSKDDTWEIIKSYKDDRIKAFQNESNLGEYANRNRTLGLATGRYVIYIDGDDIIYPHGLEMLQRFAHQFSECSMVVSRNWDERLLYPLVVTPEMFYKFEYLDRGIIGLNFTKILFNREILLNVGAFANRNIRMGDAYIQYVIGSKFPFVVVPDGFTWWRRARGQASADLVNDPLLFLFDSLQFVLPTLANVGNNLSESEKQTAYYNIYGGYLRILIGNAFKLRFATIKRVVQNYPIPVRYLFCAFKRPQRAHYNIYTGEFPLRNFKRRLKITKSVRQNRVL